MLYTITVPAGTKVLSEQAKGLIVNQQTVRVDATRQEDGGFIYNLDGSRFYTCYGVCQDVERKRPA